MSDHAAREAMARDMTLHHYTITTGHNRVSPRSEVSDDAIAALAPMLVTGDHPMPGFDGYHVGVTVDGTTLAATVLRGEAPLVTAFVVVDEAGLRDAIRITGCKPAVALTPPAVLVEVHPTASGDTALDWLGDFERCLAWAFVESRGRS